MLDIESARQYISIFNSALLTIPVLRLVNRTVSESRLKEVTYHSLLKHTRIRRGYARMECIDPAQMLLDAVDARFHDELTLGSDLEKRSMLLSISTIESVKFDEGKVQVIDDFKEAIRKINHGKHYIGDENVLLQQLPSMSVFDPMNLYVGAKVGDLIQVIRDDAITECTPYTYVYRLVTNCDYLDLDGMNLSENNDHSENNDQA